MSHWHLSGHVQIISTSAPGYEASNLKKRGCEGTYKQIHLAPHAQYCSPHTNHIIICTAVQISHGVPTSDSVGVAFRLIRLQRDGGPSGRCDADRRSASEFEGGIKIRLE